MVDCKLVEKQASRNVAWSLLLITEPRWIWTL